MNKSIVVKIGSNTLTNTQGMLDHAYVAKLAEQIAALRGEGYSVTVVTSGAIAAGVEALNLPARPSDIQTLQATAAVGQVALINAYAEQFEKHGIASAQVLLTRHDTGDRHTYLHARDTLEKLLELGVVPVINENDTVAVEEIAFGDNDTLAALVTTIIDASLVVLLTDVDGLYDAPPSQPGAQRIPYVGRPEDLTDVSIGGTGSHVGSGGMTTKVEAAGIAGAAGIPTVLTQLTDARGALL